MTKTCLVARGGSIGRVGEESQMKAVMKRVKGFLFSEAGPTATEYAVMLALIIVVALVAIQALGINVRDVFQGIGDEMDTVVDG